MAISKKPQQVLTQRGRQASEPCRGIWETEAYTIYLNLYDNMGPVYYGPHRSPQAVTSGDSRELRDECVTKDRMRGGVRFREDTERWPNVERTPVQHSINIIHLEI